MLTMKLENPIVNHIGIIVEEPISAVRRRLGQWRDYHNYKSMSTPGPAYTAEQKVADQIYDFASLKTLTNGEPRPELDLSVSDEKIESMVHTKKKTLKVNFHI